MNMVNSLEVITRYTGDSLRTNPAIRNAKEVYSAFGGTHYPEVLARLALHQLSPNAAEKGLLISRVDIDRLCVGEYIEKSKDADYLLTLKGIVAINMVSVDYFDGSDFDLSLREPFVDISILEAISKGGPL